MFIFDVNTPDNPDIGRTNQPSDGSAAQKIPPRLADRMDLRAQSRGADNLPALKNQLQLAMEMLQQAMEENLAVERRRMRRMLMIFTTVMGVLLLILLTGLGWFMHQLQTRLTDAAMIPTSSLTPATAIAPPEQRRPAPAPTPELPTIAVAEPKPAITDVQTPVPPNGADLEILQALQTDLTAVEEKSRSLDELMAIQNIQLQAIMEDVLNLNAELEPVVPEPNAAPGQSSLPETPTPGEGIAPFNASVEKYP